MSKKKRKEETIDGQHIEYLAVGRGNNVNGPVAMITARLDPDVGMEITNLLLTESEAIRLRDNLNEVYPGDKYPPQERCFPDEFMDP